MNSQSIEQIAEIQTSAPGGKINSRSEALAARLESGAKALASFAATLSEAEWQTPLHRDGRTIGEVVRKVAGIFSVEIHVASLIAAGQPITGLTWDSVDTMNRNSAKENDGVTKQDTLALLAENSAAAARAIRAFTDEELDRSVPASFNRGAPVTCQFILEELEHAVRHSYLHLSRMWAAR